MKKKSKTTKKSSRKPITITITKKMHSDHKKYLKARLGNLEFKKLEKSIAERAKELKEHFKDYKWDIRLDIVKEDVLDGFTNGLYSSLDWYVTGSLLSKLDKVSLASKKDNLMGKMVLTLNPNK